MKKLLLFIFLLQFSFSQDVITFECNGEIITIEVSDWVNPNAEMDWNGDGVIDDNDFMIYLYEAFGCDEEVDWVDNGDDWNDIDWVDADWEGFDWETVWSDYDLGNAVDWDNIPWDDIIDLNIFPDDFITYIQNIIALGQPFNWGNFISEIGGEDCCINPEWIDPMAMCTFIWAPVVGCDGIEYSNPCLAQIALLCFGQCDGFIRL